MEWFTSLKFYQHNSKPYISANDLFGILYPNANVRYTQWIRVNITHQPQEFPIKGLDYVSFEDAGVKKPERIKGGKKRQDYLLSISFALQLCHQAKNFPAKEVRNFLYKLSKE